jgi:hypothetical protein
MPTLAASKTAIKTLNDWRNDISFLLWYLVAGKTGDCRFQGAGIIHPEPQRLKRENLQTVNESKNSICDFSPGDGLGKVPRCADGPVCWF